MNQINDTSIVKSQYKNEKNLSTRISIHDKYSTNKIGFGNWIVSNYKIQDGMKVLELGCGTGDMWKNQDSIISKCSELVLTDFSDGMLQACKDTLKKYKNIEFKVVDIQNIPFEDNSFDVVIANMMLYHVPNLQKGLEEVKRVLKNGGKFYCATYGEHGIIEYIAKLLNINDAENYVNKNFTLQNGKDILSNVFNNIELLYYDDSLQVTNVDDMVDYIYSLSNMTQLINMDKDDIRRILKNNMVDGKLYVPKDYGMFIAY